MDRSSVVPTGSIRTFPFCPDPQPPPCLEALLVVSYPILAECLVLVALLSGPSLQPRRPVRVSSPVRFPRERSKTCPVGIHRDGRRRPRCYRQWPGCRRTPSGVPAVVLFIPLTTPNFSIGAATSASMLPRPARYALQC